MKHIKRFLISLLISVFIINLTMPERADAATKKYGIILGDKDFNFHLANDLVVVSPTGNLMVKAYNICGILGLTYSYDKTSKKLLIKNPINSKSLVFSVGSKNFTYFTGESAKGAPKTAAYQCYYDITSKSYLIHMSTLKYILIYKYYSNLADTYYADMGYNTLIAYSMNDYSSYDIPVTDEVINFINSKMFTTKEDLLDAVLMNLIDRKAVVNLNTNRKVMDDIGTDNMIYDLVMGIDNKNTSKDGDYLALIIDQYGQKWSSTSTVYTNPNGTKRVVESGDDPASLTINIQYETTLAQEGAVDNKIAGIIKDLKLNGASDYAKVKKIHDYLINLAIYDNSQRRYSAYNLLCEKTAVCEGYALAAYRLFTDVGLDCRIISGTGDGEPHAWNIVKVNGKWYNIDLTWDDPVTNTGVQLLKYDYFLKNDADFINHIRDFKYTTKDFMNAYTITDKSYPID